MTCAHTGPRALGASLTLVYVTVKAASVSPSLPAPNLLLISQSIDEEVKMKQTWPPLCPSRAADVLGCFHGIKREPLASSGSC